jgi:hypothetical protein
MVKMVLQKLRDLPIGSEEAESVVSAEPETAAAEPHEETIVPAGEQVSESFVLADEPAGEPVAVSVEPVDAAAALSVVEPTPSDLPADRTETLAEDEITADMIVDESAGMVTEHAVESETDRSGEDFPPLEEIGDAVPAEPEIEVAGEMVALGAGLFRLPLVIRIGDREVKTALSLTISFVKPGMEEAVEAG